MLKNVSKLPKRLASTPTNGFMIDTPGKPLSNTRGGARLYNLHFLHRTKRDILTAVLHPKKELTREEKAISP